MRRALSDGRGLWLAAEGEGRPAVVMDAGWGVTSAVWRFVAPEVARFTRVVTFDRAGLGQSDAARGPGTCHRATDDLRAALAAARVEPPYVLVGHSHGALNARVYAGRWRAEVAGVVLVDGAHEDQDQLFDAVLPAGQRAFLRDLRRAGQLREALDFDACHAEVRGAGDLGDLPLVVVAQGPAPAPEVVDFPTPPELQARVGYLAGGLMIERLVEPVWRELQRRQARLSSRGRMVVAADCGHDVPLWAPDVVASAIREVVAAVRGG